MVNDVRRAYFYAKQQRSVFIELPGEDEDAVDGEVGELLLCLYGTRDAARERQRTLSRQTPCGHWVRRGTRSPEHFLPRRAGREDGGTR